MQRILATTCSLLLAATAAASQEVKTIIITGLGYFPEITYVTPGETVRFYNGSDSTQSISSEAAPEGSGSTAWDVKDIVPGGDALFIVQSGYMLGYHDFNNQTYLAKFSFDAPPSQ